MRLGEQQALYVVHHVKTNCILVDYKTIKWFEALALTCEIARTSGLFTVITIVIGPTLAEPSRRTGDGHRRTNGQTTHSPSPDEIIRFICDLVLITHHLITSSPHHLSGVGCACSTQWT